MGYLCFLGGNGTMGPIQRLSSWWPRWLDIICPAWRMWYFTVLSKSHESCISSYLQYRYLLYIRISYFDDRYTYIYIYVYVYIYIGYSASWHLWMSVALSSSELWGALEVKWKDQSDHWSLGQLGSLEQSLTLAPPGCDMLKVKVG